MFNLKALYMYVCVHSPHVLHLVLKRISTRCVYKINLQ